MHPTAREMHIGAPRFLQQGVSILRRNFNGGLPRVNGRVSHKKQHFMIESQCGSGVSERPCGPNMLLAERSCTALFV